MAKERETVVKDGPWRRLRDQMSPGTRVKGALSRCRNMMPDPTGRLIWRPGQICLNPFAPLGGATPGSPVQLIYSFVKKNGTRYTIAIANGRFYTYDWAGTWTEILTTAELTAATITLSTTTRCSALTFADKLVISDGVNLPWTWDGTAHGGLAKLTNAPVFYGPMTQYYGRMFGIKASDRTTIVWSEVLQPNVGYEVGFANAWTVAQTDPNLLTAIFGTNDALYVFRAYSITELTGRPDTNFQSTATRDAVDLQVGTSSPWAVLPAAQGLFFLDSDYRGQLLRPGGALIPVWEDLAETLSAFDHEAPAAGAVADACARGRVVGINYTPGDLALFAVRRIGASNLQLETILVYDTKPDVPTPVAIWDSTGAIPPLGDPWRPTALAMVESNAGVPTLFHGNHEGYVFQHGGPRDAQYGSTGNSQGAAALPVIHEITTQPLTFDEKKEWIFDRLDISFTEILQPCTVWFSVETPRGRSRWKPIRLKAGMARFGVDNWTNTSFTGSRWGTPGGEIKKSIGIDARGRWAKVHLMQRPSTVADGSEYDAAYVGPYFGINQLSVTCYDSGEDPGAP